MTKEEMSKAMLAFESNGGQVKKVKEGASSIDPAIRNCKCGCGGNWTEHTMRAGESGRHA